MDIFVVCKDYVAYCVDQVPRQKEIVHLGLQLWKEQMLSFSLYSFFQCCS